VIVAILIGREGSTGFPGKNVYEMLGRPLVAYPLLAAADAPNVTRTYVSTDSPRIKEIATEYGAEIIERPPHLCTKEALGEHAYQHAHEVITEHLAAENDTPELYVLLMANAPTISAAMIEDGIKVLRDNPDYDSAVSVSCYNMWSPLRARREDENGLLQPFVPFETFGDPKTLNCDRDSQGDVWFADMGVSIVRPRNLDHLEDGLKPQQWMGQKIYPLKQEGGLDVDYAYQMPQAEYWLRKNGFGDA
jgi:CMP-N-acetylneuraminic acid synthetase